MNRIFEDSQGKFVNRLNNLKINKNWPLPINKW